MNISRNLIVTLILATFAIAMHAKSVEISKPDFAYPKTVLANAEKNIALAERDGNLLVAINALLQIMRANSEIDYDDAAFENIQRANTVCAELSATASTQSQQALVGVLYTMRARAYFNAYDLQRWKYDRRTTPDTPVPSDPSEWNGKQWTRKITALCDSAISFLPKLYHLKITDFPEIVDISKESVAYYPTLADFVASQCVLVNPDKTRDYAMRAAALHLTNSAPWFMWETMDVDDEEILYDIATKNIDSVNCACVLLQLHSVDQFFVVETYDDYDSTDNNYSITPVGPTKKQKYDLFTEFLSKHKEFPARKAVESLVENLSRPSVNASYNDGFAAGHPLKVAVTSTNCKSVILNVYNHINSYEKKAIDLKTLSPVATKTITFEKAIPFKCDSTVEIDLPVKGKNNKFFVALFGEGIEYKPERVSSGDVTKRVHAYAFSSSLDNLKTVATADPWTGMPLPDVTVKQISSNGQANVIGKTDSEGVANVKSQIYRPTDYILEGKDWSDITQLSFFKSHNDSYDNISAQILTDRSLYHRGDSIHWVAVASHVVANNTSTNISVLSGQHLLVKLFNANNEEVGKTECTTDEMGRASGSFVLAADGLSGTYTINVYRYDNPASTIANQSSKTITIGNSCVTVSDYKLPTFEIETTRVQRNFPKTGCVTIEGIAKTFAGMPVADASVDVSIFEGYFWSRFIKPDGNSIFQILAKTDSDGRFKFTVDRDSLVRTTCENPMPYFYDYTRYLCNITVTSAAGESQFTGEIVTFGKPYTILFGEKSTFDTSKPIDFDATVLDTNNDKTKIALNWRLLKKKNTVASGVYSSKLNFSKCAPGNYTIEIYPADTALADTVKRTVTLYDISRRDGVPTKNAVFFPTSQYKFPESGNTIEIVIGCSVDSTAIFYNIPENNSSGKFTHSAIIHKGWNKIALNLSGLNRLAHNSIEFINVHCLKPENNRIDIAPQPPKNIVVKSVETMRNNIVPGATETWRFAVTDSDGNELQAGVILDLYNRALDMILPHRLHLYSPAGRVPMRSRVPLIYQTHLGPIYVDIEKSIKDYESYLIATPTFNYLEYMVMHSSKFMSVAAPMMYSKARSSGSNYISDLSDGVSIEFEEDEEAMDEYVSHETIAGDVAIETLPTDSDAPAKITDLPLRDAELPVALWRPNLLTEPDGKVVVEFTVPNALATWQLLVSAWDKQMNTASMQHVFVSNKPVMIQPNMPRFLRSGDEATILSTVTNNSDTTSVIDVVVEFFDPSTSVVSKTYNYSVTVEAGNSKVVSTNITADSDLNCIGVRTIASSGKYSDGEQNVVPVLPNEQQLVEASRFVLNTGVKTCDFAVPESGDNGRVTLEYTANPIWTVVSALPGMMDANFNNAIEQSTALFSSSVAAGLTKNMPEVRRILAQWTKENADSALVSSLEKNADLKLAMLNATPWVQAARSEDERMQRLALLLDSKLTRNSIANSLKALSKLQDEDGGWRWGEWSTKPSRYITLAVLERIGYLRSLGYLDETREVKSMIRQALSFVDVEVKGTDWFYTLVRTLYFSDYRNTSQGSEVVSRTVNDIAEHWKDYNPAAKANAAEILHSVGQKSTASQILNSLSEFVVASPSGGMEIPSQPTLNAAANVLRAYARIEPKSPVVDGLRQNLIMRKRAQSWGSSILTTDAVASILLSGSRWTATSQKPTVTVDSLVLTPSAIETATGHFVLNLTPYSGQQLTISTPGKSPSYGAIYVQKTQQMCDIKDVSTSTLSIEKTMTVNRGNKWIAVAPTEKLKVGDRVRVNLTIHNRGERLDYVTILDERPAAFQPVVQLPGWMYSDGVGFYRENNDNTTCLFVDSMPRGTYILSYDMFVNNAGTYSSGAASLQSQYAPENTAHSSAFIVNIIEP